MSAPRIRTWAQSAVRWFLVVGEGRDEVRFGPYRKAGMAKGLEEHLRENAAKHGWAAALAAGAGEVPGLPPPERIAVQEPEPAP